MSFENEQEDVQADSSPEITEQSTPDSSPAPEATENTEANAAQAKSEDNVPFHQHPRFQEVIAERRALKEQNEAFAKQLREMQDNLRQLQPKEQPKDELMERLKGIDPQFAERFGKISEVDQLKQELAEFKAWREQSAAQQLQQQISSSKDKFYAENNVPADRRELYEAQLAFAAQHDTRLAQMTVADLPKVLKEIHDKLGKMFQSVERTTTKQFVEGKKAEAAKPASLKPGAPAKAVKKDSGPATREELLAEMRKAAKEQLRGDQEI